MTPRRKPAAQRLPPPPLKPPGPSLDQLARELRAGFMRRFGARNGRGLRPGVIVALLALAVASWAATGAYVVQPDQHAVITRFGAYVGEAGPGPGYHLPFPIERAVLVSSKPNELELVGTEDAPADGLVSTADGDIVETDAAVRWRVTDARKYLYAIADPQWTIRSAARIALRQAIGGADMAAVMARGRPQVEAQALQLTRQALARYDAGIAVTALELRRVGLPQAIGPALRDVANADQVAQADAADASAYRARVIGAAQGDAARTVNAAQGYAQQAALEAKGEAAHFAAVDAQYRQAPALTRQRLYTETVQQVLSHAKKLVLDLPKGLTRPIVLPPGLFRNGDPGGGPLHLVPPPAAKPTAKPADAQAKAPATGPGARP